MSPRRGNDRGGFFVLGNPSTHRFTNSAYHGPQVTMATDLSHLASRFIVFDGPDGSGKSTQFARFVRECRDAGLTVCEVREPGGTDIGEQIRRVLLDPDNHEMSVRCEMLLYMASRAQLVEQRIRPALDRGELVLADRFISSTLAYQGTAGGLQPEEILAVGKVAVNDCWPYLTVIFDVDEQTASRRMRGLPKKGKSVPADHPGLFDDRIEQQGMEFHRRVREGYLELHRNAPDEYTVIDATADEETVYQRLLTAIAEARTTGSQSRVSR
jgi:dTMP kinase